MKTSVIIYILAAVAHSVILTSGTPVPVIPRDMSTSLDERAIAPDHEVLPRNFPGSKADNRAPATLEGQSGSALQLVRRGPLAADMTRIQKALRSFISVAEGSTSMPLARVVSVVPILLQAHRSFSTELSDPTTDFSQSYANVLTRIPSILSNPFSLGRPPTDAQGRINLIIEISNEICMKDLEKSGKTKQDYRYGRAVLRSMRTMLTKVTGSGTIAASLRTAENSLAKKAAEVGKEFGIPQGST
ncbi:hypothetical protein H0H93_012801 [Arthromyces matolae]|nr:hypothetical protein H0H93_012801 [Arthromyces matolae]